MSGKTSIDFAPIATAPLSYAKDRFRLIFKKAIKYAGIQANPFGNNVSVEWQVVDEENILHYDIERSPDGKTFNKIGTELCNNKLTKAEYKWLDTEPESGNYYYRIKANNKFGVIGYSDTAKVILVKRIPGIQMYPNPITHKKMVLQFLGMPAGLYTINLSNILGQPVLTKSINHKGGNAMINTSLNNNTIKGIYLLKIIHPNKSTSIETAIIE